MFGGDVLFTSILVFTIISGIIMFLLGLAIPAVIAFALGQLLHLGVWDIQHHDNKFMGCFWIAVAMFCWFGLLIVAGSSILLGEHGLMLFADSIGFIVLVMLFAVLTYFGFHTTAFANTEISDPVEQKLRQFTHADNSTNNSKSVAKTIDAITDADIKHANSMLTNQSDQMVVHFDRSQEDKNQLNMQSQLLSVPHPHYRRIKHTNANNVLY